tara:strand:+ start:415 stop:645 length:231 start_codon:yes stop_codon:yes gene_type:complete
MKISQQEIRQKVKQALGLDDEGFEEKMDSLQDAVDGFDQMLDSLDPKLRDALNVVATDYLLVICEAVERYLQEEHA